MEVGGSRNDRGLPAVFAGANALFLDAVLLYNGCDRCSFRSGDDRVSTKQNLNDQIRSVVYLLLIFELIGSEFDSELVGLLFRSLRGGRITSLLD